MLEKLAEIVRGQSNSEPYYQGGVIPCFACDMRPVMSTACDKYDLCPNTGEPDGSLMLARWAVLLVAKGLEALPNAKEQDLKQLRSGKKLEERDKTEQAEYLCALSNLGINLMNLLSEAVISARAAAKEGANG